MVAPALRLHGRAAEIAVLGEALDRVASGRSAVVLIEGEAGIGKTRLLDAALAAGGDRERDPITVTSDPGLRFRAVDAFTDLAEELALSGPVVIGADDLQWADPSSLLTLAALSRRLAYLPVALIGCLRPSPRGPDLDRLAGALVSAGAQYLILRGLANDAVTDL